ncbi:MAG: phosphoribosylglycinamide formyltransferase [Campylobacterota bacterium]|nr:phosphoribosylglycinamide formyltransferase [Campylobacterota bacterium]
MKKIIILFSGEGTNLQNLIEQLHQKHCEVITTITNRPNAGGIARAKSLNIPVSVIDHTHFESREAFDTVLVEHINAYEPDLVIMAGFMRILTPVFTLYVKAINVHPSLLPQFKGANAIERSFESDAIQCGVSVHWVNGELDGGEVIAQDTFEKEPDETLESFTCKIRDIEHALLPKTIIELLK